MTTDMSEGDLRVNCQLHVSLESVNKYLGDYGDRLSESISMNSVHGTKIIKYLKQKRI